MRSDTFPCAKVTLLLFATRAAGSTRLAVILAYTTGLRLSELVDARIGRLECRIGNQEIEREDSATASDAAVSDPERRVILKVVGKGGKVRQVPIVLQVEALLNEYLDARGLPDWASCQRAGRNGIRLLGPVEGRRQPDTSLSSRAVYAMVKELFDRTNEQLAKKGMAQDAQIFARASTHWLRHTFGRHAAAGGVKLNVLQAVLGHASLQTTTIYASDDGAEAWDAVRGFTQKRI
jgi:site-specific recombinase XerD